MDEDENDDDGSIGLTCPAWEEMMAMDLGESLDAPSFIPGNAALMR